MRVPDTPTMEKIWNEIEPYLVITKEKTKIASNAPIGTKEKLAEYRRLGKEQDDFNLSLM